ncbi:hypothetical protein CHRYSEOSP005_09330 [Chryseobacterium sp. Alg-005]
MRIVTFLILFAVSFKAQTYTDSFTQEEWDKITQAKNEAEVKEILSKDVVTKHSFKKLLESKCIEDLYTYQFKSMDSLYKTKHYEALTKKNYLLTFYNLSKFGNGRFSNFDDDGFLNLVNDFSNSIVYKLLKKEYAEIYKKDYVKLVGIQQISPSYFCEKVVEESYEDYYKKLINTVKFRTGKN